MPLLGPVGNDKHTAGEEAGPATGAFLGPSDRAQGSVSRRSVRCSGLPLAALQRWWCAGQTGAPAWGEGAC